MKTSNVRKMTTVAMLLSLAIVLQIVEGMIPLPMVMPGIKLGFANVVGLIAVYVLGIKEMMMINLLRVLFAALLRNGFGPTFMLAFSGALFASIGTMIFKRYSHLSVFGLSVVGSSFHVTGQIMMACILYSSIGFIFSYLPILLLFSVPTGLFTGIIAYNILRKMKVDNLT